MAGEKWYNITYILPKRHDNAEELNGSAAESTNFIKSTYEKTIQCTWRTTQRVHNNN